MANIRAVHNTGKPIAIPDVDSTVGEHQRFRVHVPTANTTLLLGRRAKDTPEGSAPGDPLGYDGIDLVTDDHVFVSSSKQTITLQSPERVLVQSTKAPLTAIAKNLCYLGSSSQVFLGGTAGIVITAGMGPAPESLEVHGSVPANPKLPDLARVHELLTDAGSDIEEAVTDEVDSQAGDLDIDLGDVASAKDVGKAVADHVAGVAGEDELKADVTNAVSRDDESAGLTLHGKDFVGIGSDGEIQVVSMKSLSIGAKTNASLIAVDRAELASKKAAVVAGGETASVMGGKEVHLVSGDLTAMMSRSGKVDVCAPEILIGNNEASDPQESTDTIDLKAKEDINLTSDENITLDAEKKATITSAEEVLIKVGDYVVKVTDSKVTVEYDDEAIVTIDDSKVTVKHSELELEGDDEVVAKVGDSKLELKSSGTTISGSKIDIG